jgi:hypothetical protein
VKGRFELWLDRIFMVVALIILFVVSYMWWWEASA